MHVPPDEDIAGVDGVHPTAIELVIMGERLQVVMDNSQSAVPREARRRRTREQLVAADDGRRWCFADERLWLGYTCAWGARAVLSLFR